MYDGLLVAEGGPYEISNSTDSKGVAHVMARMSGDITGGLYQWDVAISPTAQGAVTVTRRAKQTAWGDPTGAADLQAIAGRCA